MKFKKIMLFIITLIGTFIVNTKSVFAFNIIINDIKLTNKVGSIELDDVSYSGNNINSCIKFNDLNDYVTYEISLNNNDEEEYIIDSISDNNANDNIEVSYSYADKKISSKGTQNIYVTLKYNKKLYNKESVSLNDLTITLNLLDSKGNSGSIEINPTTGDNIVKYIVIFVLVLLVLLFALILIKRRKGKGLLILLLALIPTIVIAKESLSTSIKFTNITVKGEILSYKVSIKDAEGNITERTVLYGQPIGELPEVTKDGYTFDKYEDQDGNEVTKETIVKEDITVTPKFNIVTYDINYEYNGGFAVNPGHYTVEDEITLNNPTRPGYTFAGYTGSNGDNKQTSVTISHETGNKTYIAHWNYNPFPIVFSVSGACTFNGESSNITGDECSEYHDKDYIDTNIALYSEENYDKDFEIGFDINNFDINQLKQATILNTKNELGGLISSGLVVRSYESTNKLEISQYLNSIRAVSIINSDNISKVVIVRKDGKYYYSVNDEFYVLLQDKIEPPDMHNVTAWFGASRDSSEESMRQFKGTLSNMYIRLGTYDSDDYTITFDPTGGTVDETSRTRKGLESLGNLPTPTKDDLKFDGWYTKPINGDEVAASYLIRKSITLYAHWTTAGAKVEVNGTSYGDINGAIRDIPNDGTPYTIKLLEDIEANSSIKLDKNIIINTNGHKITNYNNSYIFEVSGKLTITDGNIISGASNASAINVTSTGELYLNGGVIEATGSKQAIYNNGGKVVLDDGIILKNNSTNRATVQVLGDGILDIKDATVISNNYSALRIDKGTVNIGINDNTIDTTTPILQGKIYAVSTAVDFNMYDGKLLGRTNVVDNISKLITQSSQTVTGTEIVDGVEYNSLYLR